MFTNNQPGQRGLTKEDENNLKLAFGSSIIFESEYKPIIRFPRETTEIIRQVSELRKKDWRTTTRWNSEADFSGLLGELAAQRYLGIPAEQALTDFIKGLNGDSGHDVEAGDLKLDVKATKGDALKFKFSKTNRYTTLADGFIFTYIETVGAEIHVHLLGWCRRAELKPYLRDDGQRFFVRAETLRREGVLKPVSQLKQSQDHTQTVIHPLPTIN